MKRDAVTHLRALFERGPKRGVVTLALSAKGSGGVAAMVDHCIIVPTDRIGRAQEVQLTIEQTNCELVDEEDWTAHESVRP